SARALPAIRFSLFGWGTALFAGSRSGSGRLDQLVRLLLVARGAAAAGARLGRATPEQTLQSRPAQRRPLRALAARRRALHGPGGGYVGAALARGVHSGRPGDRRDAPSAVLWPELPPDGAGPQSRPSPLGSLLGQPGPGGDPGRFRGP